MSRFVVLYDYYDDVWGTMTLKEKAKSYDDAKLIIEDLKQNNSYSNFQIEDSEEGK